MTQNRMNINVYVNSSEIGPIMTLHAKEDPLMIPNKRFTKEMLAKILF